MERKRSFTSRFQKTEKSDTPICIKVKKVLVNFLLTADTILPAASAYPPHKSVRRVMKDTHLLLQKAASEACGRPAIV
jgi:hypothetical protein